MMEKLLVVVVCIGLPTMVGIITRMAMKYDVIIRIWPPLIKLERNEP